MEAIASKKSLDLIIDSEIGSESYYNAKAIHPMFPGGSSGVTIGIGYDLSQQTAAEISKDWGKFLKAEEISLLIKCVKITGTKAQALLTSVKGLKAISIPIESAKQVFYVTSLPKYVKQTAATYPGLTGLNADTVGCLSSIVFNRGGSLTGPTRTEMAAIKPLVAKKDYKGIAEQIVKMKRIWQGKKGSEGLLTRRDAEANMILHSDRVYDPNELVTITY